MFPKDAASALDVLAMILCPARAFAGSDAEGEEAGRALVDVKAALIRRFRAKEKRRTRN
jgi:hypothetical protein